MIDCKIDGHGLGLSVPSLLTTQTHTLQDDTMEDTLLLRRVAASDTHAFDQLYRKYKPRLERFLAKYLHQSPAVEEACNDVMLVVWNKAAQFQPTSKVSTWIFGVARIEVQRARARARICLDTPPPNSPQAFDVNTPEMTLVLREQVDTVAQAVAALPLTLRTPIVLAYYHEYSYAQIAAQMHCSQATVKVRLRQARRRLGAALTRADHRHPPAGVRWAAAPHSWRDVTRITPSL